MEDTKFRLNESKFFLERMKESEEKSTEFEYYLNAYVSSARSILWIMKSEYSKLSEWKSWYDEKVVSDEQKKLLDGIVKMRNRSLKQKPLKVREYITIGDDKNYLDFNNLLRKYIGKKVSFKIEELDKFNEANGFTFNERDGETTVTGKLKISKTVEEFKDKDIINICEEYDTWLTSVVNECINTFS